MCGTSHMTSEKWLGQCVLNVKWVSAWLSFQTAGLGWYEISHIYWKSGKKWEISYPSPFLTFTSIFNCWLVCVSYGVITSTPLFTFVVIFFSLTLKGYFPYVMFNTLALLLLSMLRDGVAFWNVGAHLWLSYTQTPTQIFQNVLCVICWHKQMFLQSSQCLLCP